MNNKFVNFDLNKINVQPHALTTNKYIIKETSHIHVCKFLNHTLLHLMTFKKPKEYDQYKQKLMEYFTKNLDTAKEMAK